MQEPLHAPYPAPTVDMQWHHITTIDTCPDLPA